jgi:16S rRNA (guanine(966)-N(2))-methyltransferase RsmD
MRIVGGMAKGIILKAGKGAKIRPTSDKVREALFNILSGDIDGSSFLDCYAGSGAVGIEALSRGAEKVVFVESDKRAVSLIKENLKRSHFEDKAIIIQRAFERSSKRIRELQDSFDLIFADPPYRGVNYEKLIEQTGKHDFLKRPGWLIIEHMRKDPLPETIDELNMVKVKYYGQTALSFYQLKATQEAEN